LEALLGAGIHVLSQMLANNQPLIPAEYNIVPSTALQDVYRLSEDESHTISRSFMDVAPSLPPAVVEKIERFGPVAAAAFSIGSIIVPRIMAHKQIVTAIKNYEQRIRMSTASNGAGAGNVTGTAEKNSVRADPFQY
jgi:hypothetical protein